MTRGLVLEGVRAGYGPVEVLHGVDLTFPAGSIVAVLGHNGSGASSVLRCAAGLVRPTHGHVRWDGADITRWSGYRRSAAGLCLVPEAHAVFTSLTVEENLALFGRPSPLDEVIERAAAVFPALVDLLDRRAGSLSGGERQMLALSRVLARPSRLILLDEASNGLTADAADRFFAVLPSLRTPDTTIVVCEQFADTVLDVADLVYVMRRGNVSFAGEPGELDDERLFGALRETVFGRR